MLNQIHYISVYDTGGLTGCGLHGYGPVFFLTGQSNDCFT